MALRTIVKDGDPILRKVCRPVEKFDEKLWTLLDDMAETMHEADGVGIAGPQVGIMRRVCLVDCYDEDGVIGEGTHTRYIVGRERFMAKVK